MKRRGAGSSAAEQSSAQQRNVADLDDRQMSAEAQQRARRKAEAEAGGRSNNVAAAKPAIPIGVIVGVVSMVCLMIYLTLKFS